VVLRRLGVALLATVAVLAAAEVVFRHGFVQSQGWGQTLASRRWMQRYWHPVNDAGFRDIERDDEVLGRTKTLVVLGDSIAAGHGIADPDDRFTNILRRRLGEDWSVVLLALPGWDTTEQARALRRFEHDPDVVVLQYFVNDIVETCARGATRFVPDLGPVPAALELLVERSYLANYAYWRLVLGRRGPAIAAAYLAHLDDCYDSTFVWRSHAAELTELVQHARSRGARIVAVVFPLLGNVDATARHAARVTEHLREQGADAVDMGTVLAGRPREEVVVNAFDHHPNVLVHSDVADRVLPEVAAMGSGGRR